MDEILCTESHEQYGLLVEEVLHRCPECSSDERAVEFEKVYYLKLRMISNQFQNKTYGIGGKRIAKLLCEIGAVEKSGPEMQRIRASPKMQLNVIYNEMEAALRVEGEKSTGMHFSLNLLNPTPLLLCEVIETLERLNSKDHWTKNYAILRNLMMRMSRRGLRWFVSILMRTSPIRYFHANLYCSAARSFDNLGVVSRTEQPRVIHVRDSFTLFKPRTQYLLTHLHENRKTRYLHVNYTSANGGSFDVTNAFRRLTHLHEDVRSALVELFPVTVKSFIVDCIIMYEKKRRNGGDGGGITSSTNNLIRSDSVVTAAAALDLRKLKTHELCIIDCCFLNGADLRDDPLIERLHKLRNTLISDRSVVGCARASICDREDVIATNTKGTFPFVFNETQLSPVTVECFMIRKLNERYTRTSTRWILSRSKTSQELRLRVLGAWMKQGGSVGSVMRLFLGVNDARSDAIVYTVTSVHRFAFDIDDKHEIYGDLVPYEHERDRAWLSVTNERYAPERVVRREARWTASIQCVKFHRSKLYTVGIRCPHAVVVELEREQADRHKAALTLPDLLSIAKFTSEDDGTDTDNTDESE